VQPCARKRLSSALALCCALCCPLFWWALQPARAEEASARTDTAETPAGFGGPASVGAQLRSDQAPKGSLFRPQALSAALASYTAFKDALRDRYGLSYGMDYNLLYQHADQSLGEENALSGVLRLFGTWTLFDQASAHPGAIEFKLELGFSDGEHTTWRKAASDAGCSEIRKFGVCLRAGWLAGVPGNGQNPLG
jgi:hypothetical protein